MSSPGRSCCVVVLGDFGRSPRMEYHSQSLLEEGYHVDIICYVENEPISSISGNSKAKLHKLSKFPEFRMPSLLKYIFKTIWQTLSLLIALLAINRPSFILVQNPPAIPAFIVCFIYCKFAKTKLVIDWHNYTHSILALNSSRKSYIVKCSRWIESYFGQKASANFCVTRAMKDDLRKNWGIEATVLYDRPPVQFQPITLDHKHHLFLKLSKEYNEFASNDCTSFEQSGVIESTAFTQKLKDGSITYKKGRPAILISSTSWTPDEDFSILLAALNEYEEAALISTYYPKLVCIITGKGPQKKYYVDLISGKNWKKISFITPWLESDVYPLLLASADLGVCLHWSSTGLDLPMKIVDMFGVGLTVCAKNFNCLNELLQHEKNGFAFDNPTELAERILTWFEYFPDNPQLEPMKEIFKKNLKKFQTLRWRENWLQAAFPVLNVS